jgi:hypothetical protein
MAGLDNITYRSGQQQLLPGASTYSQIPKQGEILNPLGGALGGLNPRPGDDSIFAPLADGGFSTPFWGQSKPGIAYHEAVSLDPRSVLTIATRAVQYDILSQLRPMFALFPIRIQPGVTTLRVWETEIGMVPPTPEAIKTLNEIPTVKRQAHYESVRSWQVAFGVVDVRALVFYPEPTLALMAEMASVTVLSIMTHAYRAGLGYAINIGTRMFCSAGMAEDHSITNAYWSHRPQKPSQLAEPPLLRRLEIQTLGEGNINFIAFLQSIYARVKTLSGAGIMDGATQIYVGMAEGTFNEMRSRLVFDQTFGDGTSTNTVNVVTYAKEVAGPGSDILSESLGTQPIGISPDGTNIYDTKVGILIIIIPKTLGKYHPADRVDPLGFTVPKNAAHSLKPRESTKVSTQIGVFDRGGNILTFTYKEGLSTCGVWGSHIGGVDMNPYDDSDEWRATRCGYTVGALQYVKHMNDQNIKLNTSHVMRQRELADDGRRAHFVSGKQIVSAHRSGALRPDDTKREWDAPFVHEDQNGNVRLNRFVGDAQFSYQNLALFLDSIKKQFADLGADMDAIEAFAKSLDRPYNRRWARALRKYLTDNETARKDLRQSPLAKHFGDDCPLDARLTASSVREIVRLFKEDDMGTGQAVALTEQDRGAMFSGFGISAPLIEGIAGLVGNEILAVSALAANAKLVYDRLVKLSNVLAQALPNSIFTSEYFIPPWLNSIDNANDRRLSAILSSILATHVPAFVALESEDGGAPAEAINTGADAVWAHDDTFAPASIDKALAGSAGPPEIFSNGSAKKVVAAIDAIGAGRRPTAADDYGKWLKADKGNDYLIAVASPAQAIELIGDLATLDVDTPLNAANQKRLRRALFALVHAVIGVFGADAGASLRNRIAEWELNGAPVPGGASPWSEGLALVRLVKAAFDYRQKSTEPTTRGLTAEAQKVFNDPKLPANTDTVQSLFAATIASTANVRGWDATRRSWQLVAYVSLVLALVGPNPDGLSTSVLSVLFPPKSDNKTPEAQRRILNFLNRSVLPVDYARSVLEAKSINSVDAALAFKTLFNVPDGILRDAFRFKQYVRLPIAATKQMVDDIVAGPGDEEPLMLPGSAASRYSKPFLELLSQLTREGIRLDIKTTAAHFGRDYGFETRQLSGVHPSVNTVTQSPFFFNHHGQTDNWKRHFNFLTKQDGSHWAVRLLLWILGCPFSLTTFHALADAGLPPFLNVIVLRTIIYQTEALIFVVPGALSILMGDLYGRVGKQTMHDSIVCMIIYKMGPVSTRFPQGVWTAPASIIRGIYAGGRVRYIDADGDTGDVEGGRAFIASITDDIGDTVSLMPRVGGSRIEEYGDDVLELAGSRAIQYIRPAFWQLVQESVDSDNRNSVGHYYPGPDEEQNRKAGIRVGVLYDNDCTYYPDSYGNYPADPTTGAGAMGHVNWHKPGTNADRVFKGLSRFVTDKVR